MNHLYEMRKVLSIKKNRSITLRMVCTPLIGFASRKLRCLPCLRKMEILRRKPISYFLHLDFGLRSAALEKIRIPFSSMDPNMVVGKRRLRDRVSLNRHVAPQAVLLGIDRTNRVRLLVASAPPLLDGSRSVAGQTFGLVKGG